MRFELTCLAVLFSATVPLHAQRGETLTAPPFSGWRVDSSTSRMTDTKDVGIFGRAYSGGQVATVGVACVRRKGSMVAIPLVEVNFPLAMQPDRASRPMDHTLVRHRFDRSPAETAEWSMMPRGQSAAALDFDAAAWLDQVAASDTTLIEFTRSGDGGPVVFTFPGEGLAGALDLLRGHCTSRTP